MKLKKIFKKIFKKNSYNVRFFVKIIGILSEMKWFSLDSLTKYLRTNELKIERVIIKLIENKKEVK